MKRRASAHLISIRDLTREGGDPQVLYSGADGGHATQKVKKLPLLQGKTVVNLFFED